MNVEQRYEAIDTALRGFAPQLSGGEEYWLLIQTILTSQSRRAFVSDLALSPGQRVLDVGSGFGALAFDLAATVPLDVTACDTSESVLAAAREMQRQILTAGALHSQSSVQQVCADAYALPFGDAEYDVVITRFLFQHLTEPIDALREIFRVLKPGGSCVVVDIDDQTILSYPVLSSAFSELHGALAALQHRKGGDREVGRKLPLLFRRAGLRDVQIQIRPQSALAYVEDNDLSLQYSLLRFAQARNEIVEAGLLDPDAFDRHFEQLKTETGYWQFSSNAEFVVTGVK